jgi:hypothetical protein
MKVSYREKRLLKEWVKERTSQILYERMLMTETILKSQFFKELVFEHKTDLILMENSEDTVTVSSILSSLDDKVSNIDNVFHGFLKDLIEAGTKISSGEVEKILQSSNDIDKAAEEVQKWFKTFKTIISDIKTEWQKASEQFPDSLRKKLMFLSYHKHDTFLKIFSHFSEMKKLYSSNKTFKELIDGSALKFLKLMWEQWGQKIASFIPVVKKLKIAWDFTKNVFSIGGKIKSLFQKVKKASAEPQEKLATVAKTLVKGKDEKLGTLGKILQLDDNIESVIDDKLKAEFIQFYTDHLRSIDPNTPIADINVNKMLTDFIKNQYGKPNVNLELTS